MIKINLLLLITLLLFSCNDDMSLITNDCINKIEFNEYIELEKICRENKFETTTEIQENLIGQWELVGIKSGWVDTIFFECIILEIDENNIILRNTLTGETTTSEWEIEAWTVNSHKGHYLVTSFSNAFDPTSGDEWKENKIGIEVFSPNLMYGTDRTDDGSSYLYERIR